MQVGENVGIEQQDTMMTSTEIYDIYMHRSSVRLLIAGP